MNERSLRLPVQAVLAGAVAAVAVSGALLITVLGVFDGAGPARWVLPTPELLAQVAQCDALPARAAREQCVQQLAAMAVSAEQRQIELAER